MTAFLAYDPTTHSAVRDLLAEIGAQPNRTLGQNFLVNPGVLDHIIEVAGLTTDDAVVEVGPGLGALTCRLVHHAGQVAAIEKDRQLGPLLQRHLLAFNWRLIADDALNVEWDTLALPTTGVKLVANLPYSISKPMLRRIFEEWRPHLVTATVMVQREVADRLVAAPATSAYGPMAIMAQLYGQAKRAFDVSPGSFFPAPDVTSSVVHIVLRRNPTVILEDEAFFWRVVRAAFGQRRKQAGNTLRAVEARREVLDAVLQRLGLDPRRRGETLSLDEFATLANTLWQERAAP